MRRCPFRINKSTVITQEFKRGHDEKEVSVIEEYPFCMTDCAYHNDETGRCLRVSVELTKLLTGVVTDDDTE